MAAKLDEAAGDRIARIRIRSGHTPMNLPHTSISFGNTGRNSLKLETSSPCVIEKLHSVVHLTCCGLDVHKEFVTACLVITDRDGRC